MGHGSAMTIYRAVRCMVWYRSHVSGHFPRLDQRALPMQEESAWHGLTQDHVAWRDRLWGRAGSWPAG